MKSQMSVTFSKVPARRTFEDVIAQIRAKIASGELREGDRLPPERELSSVLGVSRNTVREALRALEHSGVIEQKPGVAGGAFIRNNSTEVVRTTFGDLFHLGMVDSKKLAEARTAIGSEVAVLACEYRTEEDLAALTENVERMTAAALAGDFRQRAALNLEFGKVLARASHNAVLMVITDALIDVTLDFVQVVSTMPNQFVIESRRKTVEHVRAREGELAAAEIRNYFRTARNSMRSLYDMPENQG
ncbi:MAG: FadR family transcriptional regulator [Rhodobiaceae bacterium]|nr:FadR family transcriptional regulator [Rhodobiaceae bacterium]MCC0056624.1 FadR family transcriptional regulator [Rhodobiaceae bacterium]